MTAINSCNLQIGWASTNLTPEKPVLVTGQFHARISEGVMDPVTATALAIESVKGGKSTDFAVMVSCDLVAIPDAFLKAVRALFPERVMAPCRPALWSDRRAGVNWRKKPWK